jgi:hypothetical protein
MNLRGKDDQILLDLLGAACEDPPNVLGIAPVRSAAITAFCRYLSLADRQGYNTSSFITQ